MTDGESISAGLVKYHTLPAASAVTLGFIPRVHGANIPGLATNRALALTTTAWVRSVRLPVPELRRQKTGFLRQMLCQ